MNNVGGGAGIGSGYNGKAGNINISNDSKVVSNTSSPENANDYNRNFIGEPIGKGYLGTVGSVTYFDSSNDPGSSEFISNPLTVHHGTAANQRTNFYINDMHSDSLGIDMAEVTTRDNATYAIYIIESAIDYAINEATYLGSYLQRLDYIESNIVTSNENLQSAESTIRDADMAKEMTEYTKNNVLLQASQSMLAQANQSASNVLSLLQ